MVLEGRIKERIIDVNDSLLNALKLMDRQDCKLLLVIKDNKFYSLLSIGDVQRSLLKDNDIKKQVGEVLRKQLRYAKSSDSLEEVKSLMIEYRTEFMPIVDENNELTRVIFWEEIFDQKRDKKQIDADLPIVIMAGGQGTRLKPLTNIIPKPLVPIGERAILEIIMDSFNAHGLNTFLLSVNYKADFIKYYFENLAKGYDISYFKEEQPLGTAGSLHLMKDHIRSPFFISNCDIIIDEDYAEIYEYHKANKNELTAVAAIKPYSIPYGTMTIGEDGLLQRLNEKPEFTYYVNAGLYILEPHLLAEIPENEFFHITTLMENIMARNGKVGVFPVSEGSWMDIGQWSEYDQTQQKFNLRFG